LNFISKTNKPANSLFVPFDGNTWVVHNGLLGKPRICARPDVQIFPKINIGGMPYYKISCIDDPRLFERIVDYDISRNNAVLLN
jgi:hypothetical protein